MSKRAPRSSSTSASSSEHILDTAELLSSPKPSFEAALSIFRWESPRR